VRDAIVFFSGGMDSWIHLLWARREFDTMMALYVDFGHKYAENELRHAENLCDYLGVYLKVVKLPFGEFEQADSFLPLRNLFLLQIGSYFSDNLVFGMLYHEGPPDKRSGFVTKMEKLLNAQYNDKKYFEKERKIRIWTPFATKTKTEMVSWYFKTMTDDYGFTPDFVSQLMKTIGCYDPVGSCGRCISCFNRWVALTNNGLEEEYSYYPPLWAAEQFLVGKKKRQSLVSPLAVLYKWKYVKEIYTAMKKVLCRNPFFVAVELWRSKDIQAFKDACIYPNRVRRVST